MAFITYQEFNEIRRFKLNFNQLKILFSLQYLIVKEDLETTRSQKRFVKRQWLQSWSASMHDYLSVLDPEHTRKFYNCNEMKQMVTKELTKNPNNKVWYPIVILEATLFVPYTVLRRNKVDDRAYRRLRFTKQTEYIKMILGEREIVKDDDIDNFEKAYRKILLQLNRGGTKRITTRKAVLAMTSLGEKLVALSTDQRPSTIFGTETSALKGPALMSACLAAAGGGALAIGETKITGGAAAIAGGGVLLDLGIREEGLKPLKLAFVLSPDFIVLQAARLEVVVKEIILNKQKNVVLAKHILGDYEEQIKDLNNYIQDLVLKDSGIENKRNVRNLEESLEYMQKTYVNINIFLSYFSMNMGK